MVKKNPSKRVWINGTDVERKYAKEILAEVVLHKWNRVKIDAHIGDHTHCCMCEIASYGRYTGGAGVVNRLFKLHRTKAFD